MSVYVNLIVAVSREYSYEFLELIKSMTERPKDMKRSPDGSLIVSWEEALNFTDKYSAEHREITRFLSKIPRTDFYYLCEESIMVERGSMDADFAIFNDVCIFGDSVSSKSKKRGVLPRRR